MMDCFSTHKFTYRSRITGPKTQPKIEMNEFMLITIKDEMKFVKIQHGLTLFDMGGGA